MSNAILEALGQVDRKEISVIETGTIEGVVEKITTSAKKALNSIREAELPTSTHYESVNNFHGRFDELKFQEKLEEIQASDSEIAQKFGEHFDIHLDQLFHSPGAITLIDVGSGDVIDRVFQPENYTEETESEIYKKYGGSLKGHSEKKAALASIYALLNGNNVVSTSLMQETIKIVGEDDNPQSFRGPYHYKKIAGAASGSYIYHESMEQIIISLGLSIEKISLDPEYILAGIGDELFMRLMLHPEDEWDEQIEILAKDIKAHAEKGEIIKLC